MKRMIRLAVAALAVLASVPAVAQSYPTRPITLVAPFPPGGSTDVLARLLASRLEARLGQTIIIDNKPGANGAIGAAAVTRAAPDGYTILIMGASSFTINPLLYKNINYDPVKSFEYLGVAGGTQLVMLTNPTTGLSSLADVVKQSKTDTLSYGSFGSGSLPHIAGESLTEKTGAKLLHIPYKGSAPALMDLIGNQIPLTIETLVAAMPQITAGKVKPLAVLGTTRAERLPDVPTVQESGVSDFDFETWFGLVAPKGTPPEVTARLANAIRDMMADRATHDALNAAGFDPRYLNPDEFRAQVARELERNKGVIASAQIKME